LLSLFTTGRTNFFQRKASIPTLAHAMCHLGADMVYFVLCLVESHDHGSCRARKYGIWRTLSSHIFHSSQNEGSSRALQVLSFQTEYWVANTHQNRTRFVVCTRRGVFFGVWCFALLPHSWR
jgi:hypothetical protein